jgi:hypothetical protein
MEWKEEREREKRLKSRRVAEKGIIIVVGWKLPEAETTLGRWVYRDPTTKPTTCMSH